MSSGVLELLWPSKASYPALMSVPSDVSSPVSCFRTSTYVRYPEGHTSLDHNEICRIPYENASRTGLRNLCNENFMSLLLAETHIDFIQAWKKVEKYYCLRCNH